MSLIRSILLHLDATPSSAARLELARQLALRNEATLSAMFVAAPPQRPVQLAISESPAALFQPLDASAMEGTKSLFDAVAAQGGPSLRWLEGRGEPVDAFCRQALYADLLVLGQSEPHPTPGSAPSNFVESVLIDTGKPALVLPCTGEFKIIGRDVLIGWNATPQAARAVAAALPWLRSAHRVHVLEAVDPARPTEPGELDIAHYLQFHGSVPALHRLRSSAANMGDTLLSLAADVDADLLVMGCYGHSRAREFVLGGASRTVLRTMTLPVLMAH